jgi:hypothetical protein
VFLHPESKAEHALARRERKTGPGYRGFVTEFTPDITLEEDLLRRDLTINAMAQRDDGTIVDPYGGQKDLAARVLRHVSAAFSEDPVRVLRVARFAARFAHLGFASRGHGELMPAAEWCGRRGVYLVPERVWREAERRWENRSRRCISVLRDCGGLSSRCMLEVRNRVAGDRHGRAPDAVPQAVGATGGTGAVRFPCWRMTWARHDAASVAHMACMNRADRRWSMPCVHGCACRLHMELARMTCKQHTNVHRAGTATETVLGCWKDAMRFAARNVQ